MKENTLFAEFNLNCLSKVNEQLKQKEEELKAKLKTAEINDENEEMKKRLLEKENQLLQLELENKELNERINFLHKKKSFISEAISEPEAFFSCKASSERKDFMMKVYDDLLLESTSEYQTLHQDNKRLVSIIVELLKNHSTST